MEELGYRPGLADVAAASRRRSRACWTGCGPQLAIEIGTAEGACARRLAGRRRGAARLRPPSAEAGAARQRRRPPRRLARAAAAASSPSSPRRGRNVDFALVDGDHSPSGVRRDVEDLLDSPALGQTRDRDPRHRQRAGAARASTRFASPPGRRSPTCTWTGSRGSCSASPASSTSSGTGSALVVVDASRSAYGNGEVFEQRYFPVAPLLADGRETLLEHPSSGGQAPRPASPTSSRTCAGSSTSPASRRRPSKREAGSGSCARGAGG